MVDSNPSGTVFCFASGTYVLNHYITLKDSDQFICPVRRACVLTGLDQYRGAFTAQWGTAHHVIRGFVAEHFVAVSGQWPNAALQLRANGLIDDNEVRYNRVGISVDSNQTISNNFVHHNGQYGITGGPLSNLIIENNELSFNNALKLDPNNDAGGSKIFGSTPGSYFITWRGNYVHDNNGQGIWSDGNVHNVLYENNRVENNTGVGIDHEISWDATIRGNTLRNNSSALLNLGKSCWWGAQIMLNNSQNVTITDNTVEAVGTNGICVKSMTRNETSAFPQVLGNVSVQGNVVKLSGDVYTGMVAESLPSNVTFTGNTYYMKVPSNRSFVYMDESTWQSWQAAGQDTGGQLIQW